MQLASILPLDAVIAQLAARDKKHALKLLSFQAAKLTGLAERDVFSVLMEREEIGCTGTGYGVCMPHGRFEHLSSLQALFASLRKPVAFGAADGKPVDLIFLLLSPINASTEHMKALATISRLLRDKALCEMLRDAPDAVSLRKLLIAERGENLI